jgi:hypothetical protein
VFFCLRADILSFGFSLSGRRKPLARRLNGAKSSIIAAPPGRDLSARAAAALGIKECGTAEAILSAQ